MVRWPKILGLALLPAGLLFFAPVPAPQAATSSTVDILSNDAATDIRDPVDISGVKPLASRERSKPLSRGNPLWSVPLSVLTATQERPIFLASRRPPQRGVVASPPEEIAAPVLPKAAEAERPPLALIGAVVGDSDAIAVFLDRTNQKVVRLRKGEAHAGWVLDLVQGREVTLKKADRTEILGLQRAEAPAASPAMAIPPAATVPAAGGVDVSYAPFTPRSTPKNGESDGL
jgi:general secretion pathway protein N